MTIISCFSLQYPVLPQRLAIFKSRAALSPTWGKHRTGVPPLADACEGAQFSQTFQGGHQVYIVRKPDALVHRRLVGRGNEFKLGSKIALYQGVLICAAFTVPELRSCGIHEPVMRGAARQGRSISGLSVAILTWPHRRNSSRSGSASEISWI
jgi:hypothetical protein